jgi:DNA-binding CsgD family transcriptional regulator
VRTRQADRARREIISLCSRALDRAAFYEQATDALLRVVPFEGSCWHTMDPATSLITSHRTRDLPNPDQGFPLLCANEYLVEDVNKFADLAQRSVPVGVLSQTTGGNPEASLRYRAFLRPNGLDGELRVSFTDGQTCWGSLILVRPPGRDFTDEDAAFVASVSRPIARGLRRTLLVDATVRGGRTAPGLIVVDGKGRVETLTSPAHHWLKLLHEPLSGENVEWLPPAVLAVAAAVHRSTIEGATPGVSVAVHTLNGEWVELHGARAEGGAPDRVAVILDTAPADQVAPITLAASGLTRREQEVVALVTRGLATKTIAARLQLSTYTVQDHLRAIFEKLGVRSKHELVARVFFQGHLPRIEAGSPIGSDGTLSAT